MDLVGKLDNEFCDTGWKEKAYVRKFCILLFVLTSIRMHYVLPFVYLQVYPSHFCMELFSYVNDVAYGSMYYVSVILKVSCDLHAFFTVVYPVRLIQYLASLCSFTATNIQHQGCLLFWNDSISYPEGLWSGTGEKKK
jgi:hypothetical protein